MSAHCTVSAEEQEEGKRRLLVRNISSTKGFFPRSRRKLIKVLNFSLFLERLHAKPQLAGYHLDCHSNSARVRIHKYCAEHVSRRFCGGGFFVVVVVLFFSRSVLN